MRWQNPNEQKKSVELINQGFNKRIDEIGLSKFLKELKGVIKKNSISLIKDSYENLRKDMRLAPHRGLNKAKTNSLINTIKSNQNDLPIFEIEDDDNEYEIDFPIIPFTKFYIATNIHEQIENELYSISGFFVLDFDKDFLFIIYYWSRIINNGWGFSSFLSRKKGLLNGHDTKEVDLNNLNDELHKTINLMAIKKFNSVMKKLIYKINKKEYISYKKYSHGNYIEKQISFAHDVRSHKRHFWKDSGRFKIPLMSREELLEQGYDIDELVFKEGVLRRDVPFRIIADFKINNLKKPENKVYDLIEKRQLRQEEKLFNILREIFPDNYIKKHDRKILKGLELDFIIRDLRLAFEYDGYQHYEFPNIFHKSKEEFDAQRQRDRKKDKLCRRKKIQLIRVKYDEPLNKTHIKKKIKGKGVLW